jgi:hypothetical protein
VPVRTNTAPRHYETWRERAAPIIAYVLHANAGKPEKVIRKALRDAYPFGERKYWPYKVWLDEVRRQRKMPRLSGFSRRLPNEPDPRQETLFDD